MPIKIPALDERKYQDLLDESLARIPVHTPEWTNFNQSDPGVTLIEVFAFLAENLLYRANQIPERNRRKFLSLLGIPFQQATSARGLVTFANERGPLTTITLNSHLEVRAGQIPFRTDQALDVLPIEARIYYKRRLANVSPEQQEYYRQLYASFLPEPPDIASLDFYETIPLPDPVPGGSGVDLGQAEVIDGLWIALLARPNDKPFDKSIEWVRQAIAGKTLSLGVVPWLPAASREIGPVGQEKASAATHLQFEVPSGGDLPPTREPTYRRLPAEFNVDVLAHPGIVQVTLPEAAGLQMWTNLDPLELGVGPFPPSLDETTLYERLITWIRISAPRGAQARIFWMGLNTTTMTQGAKIINERLPDGTGEPDQVFTLTRPPVIPNTVRLEVTYNDQTEDWKEIEDLLSAGPEVPVPDLRQPPGAWASTHLPSAVFQLDAASGEIRCGDGTHGKRPPFGARVRADYLSSMGAEGNLGIGSVNSSPALPAGIKVANPVPTWGGANAETQREAEKHIPRYLQHRDRLVNVPDFETITWRTPGVDMGRVEILPAYHPTFSTAPGDGPGMVTIMVIPRHDTLQPEAPLPDQNFLNAVCEYLDPRRLVTTELFLRGPTYRPIWVSIGIEVLPGMSVAQVREEVKSAARQFLSPLPPDPNGMPVSPSNALYTSGPRGWPLGKPVIALELAAVISRVSGVWLVKGVFVAEEGKPFQPNLPIAFTGLELPRLAGLSVVTGDPLTMDQLGVSTGVPGSTGGGAAGTLTPRAPLPVPVIPEECT
jgi:hypothetical protein